MSKDSINISDFTGIFLKMAEKANVNGGNTLEDVEISIFDDIKSTYNPKTNTFIFENELYGETDIVSGQYAKLTEPNVSSRIDKQPIPEEIDKEIKNLQAIQQAKNYAALEAVKHNKTIMIHKLVNDKEVNFSYNKASIENYIINDSKDAKGNKITYFSDITDIREKPFTLRTKEECRKLIEFNNMVNSAINAGIDYGVDPKLIIVIIQREVGYDGLNDKVTGKNGKGYMQVTSSPVVDMLGAYAKKNKQWQYLDNLKTDVYGPEIEELFKSRGFNTDCSAEEKPELAEKIMDYLKENKDADFNIRLGTLIFRQKLNKSKGNIQIAAQNYNGNKQKYAYGIAIKRNYRLMNIKQKNTNIT